MNWQKILLDLRKHYKPICCIAYEIGMHPKTLQEYARFGTDRMLFDKGNSLLALHNRYVPESKH